jgi:hypothetical protein
MGVPTIYGSTLYNLANDLLAGYQNAVDSRALMSHLNMGKDEVWMVMKDLKEEFFQTASQSTNASADYYFPPLTTGVRQYTLPEDLRSIEFIEVTTPNYQGASFTYAKMNSTEFKEARKISNELGGPDPNTDFNNYIYTIMGQDQFVMAQYPALDLTITLWYTFALPDFEMGDEISQILFPFVKKIAEYAAKKAMLGTQDVGQFSAWTKEWRDSLINCVQAAGQRNDADVEIVESFWGDD